LGRFLSVDPELESVYLEIPQSWNRYAYVMNNPLKYVDPSGREMECVNITKDDGTIQQVCSEKVEVHGEEPKVEPAPPNPDSIRDLFSLSGETQRLRMLQADAREREQQKREQIRVSNCYAANQLSSAVGDLTGSEIAADVVDFAQTGANLSFAGDVAATAMKASFPGTYTPQAYASGINAMLRPIGRLTGTTKALVGIGNKVSPALAVFSVFSLSYNATIYVQCKAGLL
jgi:hypothetical protein